MIDLVRYGLHTPAAVEHEGTPRHVIAHWSIENKNDKKE